MKISKRPLVVTSVIATAALLLAATSVQARPVTVIGHYQIIAGTYVTAGEGATIGQAQEGAILAGTYITTGTNVRIGGHVKAGTAITLGAGGVVHAKNQSDDCNLGGGNVTIKSGTATTIGLNTVVAGTIQSGNATTGAGTNVCPAPPVRPDEYSAAGVAGLGANLAALSEVGKREIAAKMVWGIGENNATHIGGSVAAALTLTSGAYDIPGLLTIAANTTIELDAQNSRSAFIFNIGGYLSIGAGVTVKVINAPTSPVSVTWNAHGGYVSVGAGANFVGNVNATGYISTGANSTIKCGGVLRSIDSYVTLGANSVVENGLCG
jgi:hypothetical protein